jgi:hypothetical protein
MRVEYERAHVGKITNLFAFEVLKTSRTNKAKVYTSLFFVYNCVSAYSGAMVRGSTTGESPKCSEVKPKSNKRNKGFD